MIKTDRAIRDQWLVTDGVQAGDRVIVDGVQKTSPGSTVQPKEVSSGATPTAQQP